MGEEPAGLRLQPGCKQGLALEMTTASATSADCKSSLLEPASTCMSDRGSPTFQDDGI